MSKWLIWAGLLLAIPCASASDAQRPLDPAAVRQGRYLTMLGGCNDCHTAGYAPSAGKVPEARWLTGDLLGYAGPWGTTYPTNLRLRIGGMDLAAFKTYARALTTRPPMPYWVLNSMSDRDLEALWSFVKSLGPAGEHAPAALPPGIAASGPVVQFPGPPPATETAER